MAVIRVNKTKDYSVICNYHLREKEMSLKAKGLLSQMLSLPDNWEYSIPGLAAINKENETAIKNALCELKKFGYLEVVKKMPSETNSGRIEYVYNIYEKPRKFQGTAKQGTAKQGVENQPLENQAVENQGQLNTKKHNTYKPSINNKVFNNAKKRSYDLEEFEQRAERLPIYKKKG